MIAYELCYNICSSQLLPAENGFRDQRAAHHLAASRLLLRIVLGLNFVMIDHFLLFMPVLIVILIVIPIPLLVLILVLTPIPFLIPIPIVILIPIFILILVVFVDTRLAGRMVVGRTALL